MLTEPVTKDASAPSAATPVSDRTLRELAVKQVERVRSFKLHLVAFVLGTIVLGAVWVLTEYFEERTWPDRFADSNDAAGTWSPWFFWAIGIWALILGVHAFRTFAQRPPTEREIEQEVQRLRSRS